MKKKTARFSSRFLSGQAGQALILVLIFLFLGSVLLVPVLDHLSTALKTGVKYEKKTDALYAADAGIEDAIWQIKYDGLESKFGDTNFNYIFTTNATYSLPGTVNNLTTNVTISNVWIPSNIQPGDLGLTPAQLKEAIERPVTDNDTNRLQVLGSPLSATEYRIKIDFYPASGVSENLSVSSIGIWLPQGFTYDGSCSLATFADTQNKYVETVETVPGGQAVVWEFTPDPVYFTDLPPEGLAPGDMPQEAAITFNYTSNDTSTRPSAIAWMVTTGPLSSYAYSPGGGVPIAWDIDTRYYKVTSQAANTEVEAYASRSEMRDMYAATPGDYVAIGNSLMTDETYPYDGRFRDYLWSSSSTALASLPDDAYISHAYLYWSGFFGSGFSTDFWGTDSCSDFENWEVGQTRLPTGDGSGSGTWTASPYWSKVDETNPNDTDYFTGSGSSGYELFTFSAFSVPSTAAIKDITVFIRARDDSSGTNRVNAGLQVNGTVYNNSYTNPGSSWSTYTFTWTNNPATGSAWNYSDINGSGTHPLQQFGVYSTDLNPGVQVSMVYAVVNYSCWDISSSRFRGHFDSSHNTDSDRYLTLRNSVDLSGKTPGSTIVEWSQSTGGTLEDESDPANCDILKLQVSGDNGVNWSDFVTLYSGGLSGTEYNYYVIPEEYLTSQFKVRFYLDGFSGSSEYAYLDDIGLATITGSADTTADLTVDGYDSATETVNALQSQLIGNKSKGQYSFACWQDVTDFVKAHSDRNASGQPIGNANYTVGSIDSTPAGTTYELAYCGWSLVVIYHSSSTAGRQLFLWNTFSYSSGNKDLDFDGDGQPGGTIKGFIVPKRIGNETEAAKLTCFVGEGDLYYTGDYIEFNGTKLWDGTNTNGNSQASPNNVWNSTSVGMSKDGVDIDTFSVTWDSGLLHTDDTQAQIDMVSQTDNYNLIYIILSVRSKTTVGGTGHYNIKD